MKAIVSRPITADEMWRTIQAQARRITELEARIALLEGLIGTDEHIDIDAAIDA